MQNCLYTNLMRFKLTVCTTPVFLNREFNKNILSHCTNFYTWQTFAFFFLLILQLKRNILEFVLSNSKSKHALNIGFGIVTLRIDKLPTKESAQMEWMYNRCSERSLTVLSV